MIKFHLSVMCIKRRAIIGSLLALQLDLSSKENMSDGKIPAFLCFCPFFSQTVCGLVSHLRGYFSSLQLKSKLMLTVKPLRLMVGLANVFILVATSSQNQHLSCF